MTSFIFPLKKRRNRAGEPPLMQSTTRRQLIANENNQNNNINIQDDYSELDQLHNNNQQTTSCDEPLVISDTLSASVDLEDIIQDYDGTSSLKKSISSSLASLSKVIQFSQTYFSATENVPLSTSRSVAGGGVVYGRKSQDDTTSFYSALQDGFSLNEYNIDLNFNPDATGSDFATENNKPSSRSSKNQQYNSSNSNNNSHILWADVEHSPPNHHHHNQHHHQSASNSNERDLLMIPSHFQVYWSDLVYTIKPKITLFSLWNDLEERCKDTMVSFFDLVGSCNSHKGKFSINNDNGSDHNHRKQSSSSSSSNDEAIKIIQNISGSFSSGELTAVMGPSGAGKTSLLNFLSRRREEGYTGELYVETSSNRRIKISTIPQSDHLPEYLTVRENLTFASRLKNAHQSNYDHKTNVERVGNLLGLDECLDNRTKKISGGQLKRLAIAQELLSKPDILILDEPTSGLDSLTCYKTLMVLKNLVKASANKLIDPIAIVLTIHQPQREVFDLFDKIYIIANNGITIYNGPPSKCVDYVEKHTGIQLPDRDYNSASFLIEIASGEYGMEPIKKLENQVKFEFTQDRIVQRKEASAKSIPNSTGNKLIRSRNKSPFKKNLKNQQQHQQISIESGGEEIVSNSEDVTDNMDTISRATMKHTMAMEDGISSSKSSPIYIDQRLAKGSSMNRGEFWLKTGILVVRCWFSMLRDPKQMIGRILFHIALPIVLAMLIGSEPGSANACPKFKPEYDLRDLVYGESALDKNVQEELFLSLENIGILFIIIYALTCANIAQVTLSFTMDMQSSLKEYYNGWYSMPSYLLARIMSTLPMDLTLPMMTVTICYTLSGQNPGDNGLWVWYRVLISSVSIILSSMIGQTLGMIIGALYMGHVITALFASQAITLPLAFLSGFVVRTKNMSKFVYFLSKISIYKHALEVCTVARYGFDVCDCPPGSVTGRDAKIVGVPEKFNQFLKYWVNTIDDSIPTTTTIASTNLSPFTNSNDTTDLIINSSNNDGDDGENKLFKLFAKQISLYNTYGRTVKSCADVKPFQLHDLGLSEKDIPLAFISLATLLITTLITLFVTVKLVVHFRTSL